MLEKKLSPFPLGKIQIEDKFWKEYMELVREHVIPYQWEALNDRIPDAQPSHCIENFRVASGQQEGTFQGMVFQDSDVYKWLEAVAYSLTWHKDEELEKTADETIDLIGAAQQPDGYLDTYYIINGLEKRFTNLMDNHELYCFGHMTEAAVAYYRATGKRKFLDIAIKYAECIAGCLGTEEGKIPGYPGHEVAEMALAALYEVTGDEKHLKLAKYFIDQRGQAPLFFEEECKKNGNTCFWDDSYMKKQYYQAGKPVREQDKAEGHAVRAVYLYSGMAEVASKTEDKELFEACRKLWDNITQKQMYVTGAIGATEHGEAFSFDYDLPNDTVYGETCAAIGLIFFARRMFEITKDSRYADVMEQALYNGVISGMSLDGKSFFYVNPLEVEPEACLKDYNKRHVKPERQKWFGCACCPPNVARLLSSIGGYAFEESPDSLYMNLFVGGKLQTVKDGKENQITVETRYPWAGQIKITVENKEDSTFALALRIPGWCQSYSLKVNKELQEYSRNQGYAMLERTWKNGDEVLLTLDMPVQLVEANPLVREDLGKVAVTRGPLVYCLEETDNGKNLSGIYLEEDADFTIKEEPELLKGVVTIETQGKKVSQKGWNGETLYRTYQGKNYDSCSLKFIPYYAWTNRGIGEMTVWVKI
ncbi:MAG TPA: glycoside hydrolase family 127 protein [Candidatus Blautia pullicola]|uniref:Glycoside hydrolase family 127 protein n=1 Tax=Candidatus Blautia pullicola TaxID=2838498 RepID=A0A9D2JU58_9FIRM|nr:glycoside hydrolase family 127 protein [Candidatus Blautia pullicola]